ncbi:AAA ATPase-like protein [Azospirillum brasilense]|uniref:AAA ATPase-like protein n=1 Tax=Azospirillum brasilense TaxID=192 RepID=A0A560AJ72_AZOBR|nr:AAA family ATPase [Azospirillum brasilense]TWA60423.1 AAA ATPase-like protein [Azospirillum brasilense]
MRVVSFGCRNYKPFKGDISVELRPLTLVFGKNSSGKSALIRLMRLLLRALSARCRGGFPLEVDELSFGTTFRDLIHGKSPHGNVSFSLKLQGDDGVFDMNANVQNIDETIASAGLPTEYSVVSRFELREPFPLRLDWIPAAATAPEYEGKGVVPFRGLMPSISMSSELECGGKTLQNWRGMIQEYEAEIEHLGPFRARIYRVYSLGTKVPLGFDGSGAPIRLALDDRLADAVSSWYKENLDGWRLVISKPAAAFQCIIARGNSLEVNLADVGQGMQQVLPIVVQQLGHQIYGETGFLDIIEQPELHLHTAAQAPLGELFLNTATLCHGQVIVETHSENLLLRIRRLIAEGADPALVALYWVDEQEDGHSTVRRIHIDQDGNLDWWREGVFSEGYEEVRAIRRAVRGRTPSGGAT